METKKNTGSLNKIRIEIQKSHLILIISITILLCFGGAFINLNANNKAFNQNLQDTAELISKQYEFSKELSPEERLIFLDSIAEELTDVDRISIVDTNLIRLYHTNHDLIGKEYTGTVPDFTKNKNSFYTENTTGPSGPQRRAYSALYDKEGNYTGFIMTIMLNQSMNSFTRHTICLFLAVIIIALIIEILISQNLSERIKKQFLEYAEDLEGTKFLVDSMRANNHDFTNKLHVILGLIQIGEYEKAENYIENISIIQRETVSKVMNSIDNASFAALLIGKIARASECNVKFILDENTQFHSADISIPSEALVTICGNLIDNALDAMNMNPTPVSLNRELKISIMTVPGKLLITVKDNGCGIPESNYEKVFENGFSTKGTGRGVGLYHTKQLIESLGGKISFESQEGKGTCFMVIMEK